MIANCGVGVNHIDLAAAAALGFLFPTRRGAHRRHGGPGADADADAVPPRRRGRARASRRRWAGWRPTHLVGQAMTGKRLGIIGMGRIGKAVAQRAHFGFGMEIGCFNRSPFRWRRGRATQYDSVAALCAASDFVSLHCAATPDTFEILNEEALAAMSADAYVINTARGDVVDETALVAALESGAIAGAGLDVFRASLPSIRRSLRRRTPCCCRIWDRRLARRAWRWG